MPVGFRILRNQPTDVIGVEGEAGTKGQMPQS